MKNKFIIITLSSLLITGCGGDSYDSYSTVNTVSNKAIGDIDSSYSYDMTESELYDDTEYSEEAEIVKSTQMIIRDANISVNVENLEEFDININNLVIKYAGYFEKSEINDYSSDYSSERYGYYTIRIPNKHLDDFLNNVDGAGNITQKRITSEDVSLQYVDLEAKIKSLEDEKDRLNKLADDVYNIQDLMDIQDKISNVQYQLDSQNGQKRYLEGRVSYSTIEMTAIQQRDVDHPVRRAFSANFKDRMLDGVESAVDLTVGIITAIPVIIVILFFGTIFVWIIKKVYNKFLKGNVKIVKKQSNIPVKKER